MPPQTRIQIAKADIVKLLDSYPSRVIPHAELGRILSEHRAGWRLAQATGLADFVSFLASKSKLVPYVLSFPHSPVTAYSWGPVSPYELAMAIGPNAYISHFSAAFLHGISEQVPKTIYVTVPQPRKSAIPVLTQEDIDKSFAQPIRASSSVATLDPYRVVRLAGMDTGGLGIQDIDLPDRGKARVTTLERTLIDITVRPNYAGGPAHVIEIFRLARGRGASVNHVLALLKGLRFAYPYHQAIGFYLERAGYSAGAQDLVLRLGLHRDFYLTHGMVNSEYSLKWRLHFPEGL